MMVQPGGLPCVCGRQGCLEAEACGPAIAGRAKLYLTKESSSFEHGQKGKQLLKLAGGDPETITAQMVSQAAAKGDKLSQHVLGEAAGRLGLGLGNVITLMNTERVILGGGVTKAGERWWQIVQETAQANTLPEISVEIVPAAFSDDAPLWGAIVLAQTLLIDH